MNTFGDANSNEIRIYDILKTVLDPELGINIIDLGLIYEISFSKETGIKIIMTLTTEGCPMGDAIDTEIKEKLKQGFGGFHVSLEVIWEPQWTAERISHEGRIALGIE